MFQSENIKINIKEFFRGLRAGRLQSVGNMQVIPLTTSPELMDNRFVSSSEALVSTTQYGTMVFKNESEKVMIIPSHVGYITKQAAQNHAMVTAKVLEGGGETSYNNAICIQETQGGTMASGKHKMVLLPFPLRESTLAKRNGDQFSRMWPEIRSFNSKAGVVGHDRGNIDLFFDQFEEKLSQFVAQFECIENQVGAIILIDGMVVGVERTPSSEYWLSVWEVIIRDCYGSLSMTYEKIYGNARGKSKEGHEWKGKPHLYVEMRRDKISSIQDLKSELKVAEDEVKGKVKGVVQNVVSSPVIVSSIESDTPKGGPDWGVQGEDLSVYTVEGDQFIGQMVKQGGVKPIYTSLISKEKWIRSAPWFREDEFSLDGL